MRPPGNLFVVLAVVATASAATFTWVGWELLRQDRAAEAQRKQERLNGHADRAVQSLERLLGVVEEHLTEQAAASAASAATLSRAPQDGLVVLFTASAIQPVAASTLLFYPVVPARSEPPATIFAAGEAAEFQHHDPQRAMDAYRRLARSPDPAVRAAALMRLGRTLRNANRGDEALAVYAAMAALGDVPVIGLPADLVARDAGIRLLDQRGRRDTARDGAQSLQRDLAAARWKLTSGQYEQYTEDADRIAGGSAQPRERIAIARAVGDLWATWRTHPTPRGRALFRADATLLVVWRSTAKDQLAAWVVPPDRLLARLTPEAGFTISIGAGDGVILAGTREASPQGSQGVVRTTADTGLPFAVLATSTRAGADATGFTHGQFVVLGLGVMLIFLVVGSYFIGRAVKQEMDLARLQTDFVSAVSHEFRTPLASMRQLSELLAAGRVPLEARRQHYYESLASESRRLQRLVENLLEFGKLEAGARPYQIEPIDPGALVEAAVTGFQSQLTRPECRIESSGEATLVRVLADPEAVTLALHNLMDNAVKYSGGRTVRVDWAPEGDRIAFSVRDEGLGIAPDEQSRIFRKFVRGASATAANVKGTGVGLAIVQLIVTGHGGEIRVASEINRGSTFTIVLPAARPDEAPPVGTQRTENV